MTYLERITYLTGNFLQASQFALKNAYRVVALTKGLKNRNHYFDEVSVVLSTIETEAREILEENKSLSGDELISYFETHSGLSNKDFNTIKKVLNKRDELVSLFYIKNSYDLSKEDVNVYEKMISDLENSVEVCSRLNVSLSKAADKLYDAF